VLLLVGFPLRTTSTHQLERQTFGPGGFREGGVLRASTLYRSLCRAGCVLPPLIHSGPLFHYNGAMYRERKGGGVESRQAWGIGIGAFVGAVLGGIMGPAAFGPGVGLYVGIALGAAIGAGLGGILARR
jgi:hypothetical protein